MPPPPPGEKKDGGPEEQLPRRFGKYTLLRKLAMGGMAEIYLALQRSVAGFEKLIVVKRVLPNLVKDTAFITMLLDEARIAATLNHPNIAQVYDAGSVDGQYYIAMEHVHGEDLRSIVRGMKTKNVTAFPLEHALAITLGMTAGLSYAHEQRTLDGEPMNIVHRDVSPQNVLVTFNGDVKLVDFGIAKAGRSKEEETKTGTGGKLKGKVPYMSPEQAQGQDLDARSDIFALGVMLFELTTGRRLFRGANEFETLKMIVEQEYPSPRTINPNIAPRLEEIIVKALQKDREKRYQTARELQAELEDYIRQEKLAVSPLSLGEWMQMLFAEKLSAQKQMLMEGKQLADVLAQQAVEEAEAERASLTASGVRARRANRIPLIIAAIVVVLAVVGAGIAIKLFGGGAPRGPGVIAITSDPPGATVWIDGDQQDQRTPATVTGLPVGQRHSVKLTRDGYAPFTETVELTQARQRGSVSAHLVLPTASMFGVLRLVTTPTGAHVLLDGRDTGKVTPTTVDEIAPGEEHNVSVSLDGWVPKSERFTVQAGQVQDYTWTLDRTPLAANESLLHVVTDPRDARFTFDGTVRTDGPPFDLRVASRTYHVSLRKDGYVTQERDVPLAGGQVVNLELRLERNREVHRPGGHDPPPPGGGGPGTLTFDARPWCNVSIDGANVGQTPVVNRSLPAGHHRVTCTNPELGVTRTVQVEIVSGQPTRQRLQLP